MKLQLPSVGVLGFALILAFIVVFASGLNPLWLIPVYVSFFVGITIVHSVLSRSRLAPSRSSHHGQNSVSNR